MAFVDTQADRLPPTAPSAREHTFHKLLLGGCVLAALTHVAFGLLFAHNGVQALAIVNVASVLAYVLSALLLQGKHPALAMALMALEVAAHATLAVWAVGWDSGFHYYLLILLPVILTSPLNGWAVKVALSLAPACLYVALDWGWRHATPWHPIDASTLAQLHSFNLVATMAILGMLTVLYVTLIQETERRLHEAATTDSLTGLLNRRSMQEALHMAVARGKRQQHPLTVIMVDIDHFKALNDGWGHALGDEALQAVAQVLKGGLREVDHVARWGGEEFLIVLPVTSLEAAQPVAERLRQAVADLHIRAPIDGTRIPLSVTLGLSHILLDEAPDQAIQRADAALYEGKALGRNRVVVVT